MSRFTPRILNLLLATAAVCCVMNADTPEAEAGRYRQTYSSWNYHPSSHYYYSRYSYYPTVTTTTYHHHYAVHYPSRPRYVYYYNPVRRVYWGRYDLKEAGYSMLKPEDRKEKLDDIPESAFPALAKMPEIPESSDGVQMDPPTLKDLPNVEAAKDTP